MKLIHFQLMLRGIIFYCPFTSIITNSDRQPVLNLIAQSEMPEVTIKSVFLRRSIPYNRRRQYNNQRTYNPANGLLVAGQHINKMKLFYIVNQK